jgi:hypothetical protein
MRFGELLADLQEPGANQAQPATFEPGDDLSHQPTLDAIGFD